MSDLVSVIVPVFNRSSVIARALDSIVNQTYQYWEALVVDDSSTDDTISVIRKYAGSDSRIRLIQHDQNRGAQAARNTGIHVAEGRWIAFLDSDDLLLPNSLEDRIRMAIEKGVAVVHSECYVLEPGDAEPRPMGIPPLHGQVYKELLRERNPVFPGLLVSKEALVRIDYLDEEIVSFQEWDTTIRLAKYYEFAFVSRPTFVYYYDTLDAISRDPIRTAKGYEQVLRKHRWSILRHLGPRALALHYQHAANYYRRANEGAEARRCLLSAILLWPFRPGMIYGYMRRFQ
jgi:glycosyltransferase involved in cell wall biosynthesis